MPDINPDDVPTITVEDVAAPYADLPPELHLKMFRRLYTGPEWRFELTWPDGTRRSVGRGATAADVVDAIARSNESRWVHAEILASMALRAVHDV